MKRGKSQSYIEKVVQILLFSSAILSAAIVFFIILFIFIEGMPLFKNQSILDFLFSKNWDPTGSQGEASFGNFSFIISSIGMTLLALLFACPIGICGGIYLSELAHRRWKGIMRSVVQLLAGIPSVIYGIIGYILIAPIIRNISSSTTGLSMMTGAIVLSIMILPTIINMTEISLQAVKKDLREASFALGATKSHTIFTLLLPAAKSGIGAGIILAMGRAIGETMAVLMVAGNKEGWTRGIFDETRSLTMNIANGINYASGDYYTSLFTSGALLFIFIFTLNSLSNFLINRGLRNE